MVSPSPKERIGQGRHYLDGKPKSEGTSDLICVTTGSVPRFFGLVDGWGALLGELCSPFVIGGEVFSLCSQNSYSHVSPSAEFTNWMQPTSSGNDL